ncbi:unnamed protein product [Mytilus edulis]|uniref:Chromo domain-containing protein n=1 Tax=Mytilus edulis TaxID=6550 RepID=A0A8S3V6D5_MYTED|nr:unnamed protein product [Mytilus edulis]
MLDIIDLISESDILTLTQEEYISLQNQDDIGVVELPNDFDLLTELIIPTVTVTTTEHELSHTKLTLSTTTQLGQTQKNIQSVTNKKLTLAPSTSKKMSDTLTTIIRTPTVITNTSSTKTSMHTWEDFNGNFFRVAGILGEKKVGRKGLYLVHWDGYPVSQATWEPKGNIPSSIISCYNKKDNAGYYKDTDTINALHQSGKIATYDFCEAQDGNESCYRTAATVKCAVKRNDVLHAVQLKKQFKAQESKRNISVSHPVDEPITEDHNYVHANTYPVFSDSDLELGASCTIDPSLNNDWKTGRRVVELQALAQQMFCTSCDARLHLTDIESERRYGLGSILFIRCQNSVCSSLNDVKTGKRNNGTFDINSKLALAMVHTGMGPVQINNLLATLNLPPVVPSTLKRREQKIDTTLETVAKKSCLEAQKEEIEKGNGKVQIDDQFILPVKTVWPFKIKLTIKLEMKYRLKELNVGICRGRSVFDYLI